ncbi:MAG: hypothetical protein JF593_03890 [Novosphingobium sp.]|nr:hypothetical protein [Novosphingobium sp.]
MAEFVTREKLHDIAALVAAPVPAEPTAQPVIRETIDRSFELPTGLYVATAAGYLGFLAVMWLMLKNAELILPLVICTVFIAMFFGVAHKWTSMHPTHAQRPMRYDGFRRRGIVTATGHLTANEASLQVLILPVLIFIWGLAIAVIVALT